MTCQACREHVTHAVTFCPHCGTRLSGTRALPTYAFAALPQVGNALPVVPAPLHDRYRIVSVLGGTRGRLFAAEDICDPARTRVAIKERLESPALSPQQQEQAAAAFAVQASTLHALHHPGLPAVREWWSEPATSGPMRQYLVTDHVAGKTLDLVLQEAGGRVHWTYAACWGAALSDLLAYLHRQAPPLLAHGLALRHIVLQHSTGLPVLVDPLSLVPAATYGAPIDAGADADPRDDQFALGALIHALVSGRDPQAELARLQRRGVGREQMAQALFPPLDQMVAGVAPAMGRVVARATAAAPQARFPNAEAMAEALVCALQDGHAGGAALARRPTRTAPIAAAQAQMAAMQAASPPPYPAPIGVDTQMLREARPAIAISGIAAGAGFISSFTPWYAISFSDSYWSTSISLNGWHHWGLVSVLLFLLAGGLCIPAVANPRALGHPQATGRLLMSAGLVGAVCTVMFMFTEGASLIAAGSSAGPSMGAFVGLLCSLIVAFSGATISHRSGSPGDAADVR